MAARQAAFFVVSDFAYFKRSKQMNVESFKINDVIPYKNNPRNNDEAVESTANSIREFGWQQPIVVDNDHVVIVGHTRLRAAKRLGLETVPVVVASNLTQEQADAYRLADNKTGELAEWDDKLLKSELDNIMSIDMTDFGFEAIEDEIEEIEEAEEKPEIEFTQELLEENNYVVLKFDNEVDWLQALTVFDLEKVKALHSKDNFEAVGLGRVIDGAEALSKLSGV